MARGSFTIVELFRTGGKTSPIKGERFEWTADPVPSDPTRGGARAAPIQPWTIGLALRTQRTDYPGAKRPTEQVLGPIFEPFTLSGNFRDKYNFPGYAVWEMERLEAMVKRGNVCQVAFQEQSFECLITNIKFAYRRDYDIGYEFTVSNHGRSAEKDLTDRSPTTVLSASDLSGDANTVGQALGEEHLESPPRFIFNSNIVAEADDDFEVVQTALAAATATITQRDIEPDMKPVDAFRRIATQFRAIQERSAEAIATLVELRADLDLVTNSAVRVLDFEVWSRAMRTNYRAMIATCKKSADLMDERADPRALRLHRATQGESLYSVSNQYYGTPHAWRYIADRNGLDSLILTGDELLIIPERGGA